MTGPSNGPLFVWFEQEAAMSDWPAGVRPLYPSEGANNLVQGYVVLSDEPPGSLYAESWRPTLVGPIPLSHGHAAAEELARGLRAAGLAVSSRSVEAFPRDRAIGFYAGTAGRDVAGVVPDMPIFGVRPLPAKVPRKGRALVQVLVNSIGGPAWINADVGDIRFAPQGT